MKKYMIFVGVILCMNSCLVTTLNPIYTSKDLVFNTQILGDWIGGKIIWTFIKDDNNSYSLSYKECDDPINNPEEYSSCTLAEFKTHLVELNDEYYMNFLPTNFMNTENTFIRTHIKSMNSFVKVEVDEEMLRVSLFNTQWFESYIEENPKEIDFVKHEEGVIITATTEELQKFIKKHASDPEVFINPTQLKRYKVVDN